MQKSPEKPKKMAAIVLIIAALLLSAGCVELFVYPVFRLAAANHGTYHQVWSFERELEDQTTLRCYVTEHDGNYCAALYYSDTPNFPKFRNVGQYRGENYATTGVGLYNDATKWDQLTTYIVVAQVVTEETPAHFLGEKYDAASGVQLISEEVTVGDATCWVLFGYSEKNTELGTDLLIALASS
jgi:hypothetical protein